MKMGERSAGNSGELALRIEIGGALKFHRGDDFPAGRGVDPRANQAVEPVRIADHIGKQPVDLSDFFRSQGESTLLDMMNEFVERYPQLKLFSLPKLDKRRTIELGMKGELAQVELAMQEICQRISQMGYEWQGIAVSE